MKQNSKNIVIIFLFFDYILYDYKLFKPYIFC